MLNVICGLNTARCRVSIREIGVSAGFDALSPSSDAWMLGDSTASRGGMDLESSNTSIIQILSTNVANDESITHRTNHRMKVPKLAAAARPMYRNFAVFCERQKTHQSHADKLTRCIMHTKSNGTTTEKRLRQVPPCWKSR